MDHSISAAEANRSFSRILQEVRGGQSYMITAHGKPVARLIPCQEADAVRAGARAALFRRLEGQQILEGQYFSEVGPWRRDELYDR